MATLSLHFPTTPVHKPVSYVHVCFVLWSAEIPLGYLCCCGFGTTHWSQVIFAVGSRAKDSDSSPSQNLSVAHGSVVQSRLFSVSPSPSLTGDKAGLVWTSTGSHSCREFIIATIVLKGWHFIVLYRILWLLHEESSSLLCQEYTSYLSLPLAQPELLARPTGLGIGLLALIEWVLNAIGAIGYLGSQQPSLYYMCRFCTDIYFQCSWASSYE